MMPQSKSPKNFTALIEDMKTDSPFFNRIGPTMALLKPGNWNGLIELAGLHGYTVQQFDILQYINELQAKDASVGANNTYLKNWLDSVHLLKNAAEPN